MSDDNKVFILLGIAAIFGVGLVMMTGSKKSKRALGVDNFEDIDMQSVIDNAIQQKVEVFNQISDLKENIDSLSLNDKPPIVDNSKIDNVLRYIQGQMQENNRLQNLAVRQEIAQYQNRFVQQQSMFRNELYRKQEELARQNELSQITKQQYEYAVQKLQQESTMRERQLQQEMQRVQSLHFQTETKQKNENATRFKKVNDDLKKAQAELEKIRKESDKLRLANQELQKNPVVNKLNFDKSFTGIATNFQQPGALIPIPPDYKPRIQKADFNSTSMANRSFIDNASRDEGQTEPLVLPVPGRTDPPPIPNQKVHSNFVTSSIPAPTHFLSKDKSNPVFPGGFSQFGTPMPSRDYKSVPHRDTNSMQTINQLSALEDFSRRGIKSRFESDVQSTPSLPRTPTKAEKFGLKNTSQDAFAVPIPPPAMPENPPQSMQDSDVFKTSRQKRSRSDKVKGFGKYGKGFTKEQIQERLETFSSISAGSFVKPQTKRYKPGYSTAVAKRPKTAPDKKYIQSLDSRNAELARIIANLVKEMQKNKPSFTKNPVTETDKLLVTLAAHMQQLKNDTPSNKNVHHQFFYSTQQNPFQIQSDKQQLFYETFVQENPPDTEVTSYKLNETDDKKQTITVQELETSAEYKAYKDTLTSAIKQINTEILGIKDEKMRGDYANLDVLKQLYSL